MHARHLEARVKQALAENDAVLLQGPRHAGKSFLARGLAATGYFSSYVNLEDTEAQAAARRDPAAFLAERRLPLALDEAQRVPALFPVLQSILAKENRPGGFLLIGSTAFPASLAAPTRGKIASLRLSTLSQGEIRGRPEGFLPALLAPGPLAPVEGEGEAELLEALMVGGFPDALTRPSLFWRKGWFSTYLSTLLRQEVRDLSSIQGLPDMPRLLSLAAERAATLANFSEFARTLELPPSTLLRYVRLLEDVFLVWRLPPSEVGRRAVKTSKIYLEDTGLLAHLRGGGRDNLKSDPGRLRSLLENFAACELRKQASFASGLVLSHFRTHAGQKVDLVVEDGAGGLAGIEIKAASTVGRNDFKGLHALAEAAGKRFRRGMVLHLGRESRAFGWDMHAYPISALWRLGSKPN